MLSPTTKIPFLVVFLALMGPSVAMHGQERSGPGPSTDPEQQAKRDLQETYGHWAHAVAVGERQGLSKSWAQKGTPIDPSRCALLVVHMQNLTMQRDTFMDAVGLYNPEIRNAWYERLEKTTIPNIEKLITFFRSKQLPIFFTHLGNEGTHPRFLKNKSNKEWDISTTANVFINACGDGTHESTQLDELIQKNGIDTLFIAGVGTSHCVTFSTYGAMSRGYQVIVVPDSTADPRPDHFEAILKVIGLHGFLKSTDQVVSDYPWQSWIENRPLPPTGLTAIDPAKSDRPAQSRVTLLASAAVEVESVPSQLFPTDLADGEWLTFPAAGFSAPVVGVVHRRSYPAKCGMPLGGIGTGCIDLETSGMLGLSSIFNSHTPRRGSLNLPFLGLAVGGETWVLTTGMKSSERGKGYAANAPRPPDLELPGCRLAKDIHYWGHYPVADLEFETDAPVSVGLRAWAPLLPGDAGLSNTPGAVFEVHLRNTSNEAQSGRLVFSFPGPTHDEAHSWKFERQLIDAPVHGVYVTSPLSSYVLGVVGQEQVQTGDALGQDGWQYGQGTPAPELAKAWAQIGTSLPPVKETRSGTSLAVDFQLAAGAKKTVRYVLAWYSPRWMASGDPARGPRAFWHMYSARYADALEVAELLARDHQTLLRRILAWQQELFTDQTMPEWMREVLLNMLHVYAESGFWAAAKPPIGDWCHGEDGLFALCESPRSCAQMECLPAAWYGRIPLDYFFPQMALSTLRAEKAYQFENGAPPFIMGGLGGWSTGPEIASPTIGYTVTLNPTCYVTMVDRYRLLYGDDAFVREFYPSVKRSVEFMVDLNRGPHGVVSMPDRLVSTWPGVPHETEWYEWGRWVGIAPHVGGLHLATLRMAHQMAEAVGDKEFSERCRHWIEDGTASIEDHTWLGTHYMRFFDPETGEKSHDIFSAQLDGQVSAKIHGLKDVFRPDRVAITLDTIKRTCVAATKLGTVLYATPDGKPVGGGSDAITAYPPNETFYQAVTALGLMYMYAGEKELGMEINRRAFHNSVCVQGLSWYGENSFDSKTGVHLSGSEYAIKNLLWAAPAAVLGEDLASPARPGGLVDRMLKASQR